MTTLEFVATLLVHAGWMMVSLVSLGMLTAAVAAVAKNWHKNPPLGFN